ncbi:mitochondrial inner membrane m-AAA protease component paraplegin-like [Anticarsia gemmatalis]|uniref:mitochondrial inner membrane m-AAA protease component paraplegin-like n=1 Tax=Anticarsia gemmatalis TaxID=129554 RepID=UPI003F76F545
MLSIKRLPALSASKIQPKINFGFSKNVVEKQVNKHNFVHLCRSFSVLHNISSKSKNPQLRQFNEEYKAACALLKRSNLPSFNSVFNNPACLKSIHTSSSNYSQDDKDKDKDDKKKKNEEMSSLVMKAVFWMFTTFILIMMSTLLLPNDNTHNELIRYVSWNEFVYTMLSKGEVEELIVRPDLEVVTIILHEGAIIKGKRTNHRVYHMNVGDIHRFEEKLRETEKSLGVQEGVRVIYDRNGSLAGKVITTLLIGAIILSFLYSTKSMRMNISLGGISQLGRAKFTLVDSMSGQGKGVKFADVAGLREAKIEVMEFVDYLKRPEHYKSLGAKVPKGALLLGPPGCGKTLLAKAVATEANVPFLSMNGSEFIEMIGGLGAARVRDLFKEAVSRAPCIIYIDEMDAVGRARSAGTSSFAGGGEGEQTLNQLLVEMDGMKSREGVVVLASTNRADVLDKALLRPGRFDRHILIDLPTLQEREEIFERHLKNIVLEDLPDYYVRRLAFLTPGFSGADIANVCNEAALHAARHKQNIVKAADLEYAVERVVGGTEKRSHAMSPAEKRIVAYHEAGHALAGWLLEHTDALLKLTIVPRTNMALGFAQYSTSDQKLYSKEELFDRMCMALGGRAAEAITFNSITSGAQNDLDKVTKIAYAQIRVYGMSPRVGLVSFPDMKERGRSPFSKALKELMDLEARKLIADAYYRTEQLLKDNEDKLKDLAEELLKKETLNFKDVHAILGPPPFPKKKFIDPVEFEQSLKNMEKAATPDDSPALGAPSAKPAPDSL